MPKTVGKRLKMLRNNLELNQKEFAEYLCVNPRSYERWEQDKGIPDIQNLLLIVDALHISLDWLLCREDFFLYPYK